jgi:hypothetical protein
MHDTTVVKPFLVSAQLLPGEYVWWRFGTLAEATSRVDDLIGAYGVKRVNFVDYKITTDGFTKEFKPPMP